MPCSEVGPVLLAKFPREGNPRQLKAWVGVVPQARTASAVRSLTPLCHCPHQIVFGIAGLDRTGTDPTVGTDRGEVKFDRQLDMSTVAAQEWILDLCSDIRNSRSACVSGCKRELPTWALRWHMCLSMLGAALG